MDVTYIISLTCRSVIDDKDDKAHLRARCRLTPPTYSDAPKKDGYPEKLIHTTMKKAKRKQKYEG